MLFPNHPMLVPRGLQEACLCSLLIQSVLILAHWNLPGHLLAGDRLRWGEIRPWQRTRSYSGHLVQGSLIPLNHSEDIGGAQQKEPALSLKSRGRSQMLTLSFSEHCPPLPLLYGCQQPAWLSLPAADHALSSQGCRKSHLPVPFTRALFPKGDFCFGSGVDLAQLCCLHLYTIHVQLEPHPAGTEARG